MKQQLSNLNIKYGELKLANSDLEKNFEELQESNKMIKNSCENQIKVLNEQIKHKENLLNGNIKALQIENEKICNDSKEEIKKAYADNAKQVDSYEKTIQNLKALKDKGIKISVGSSSVNAIKILKKAGIYAWFDVVYDGTMITKAKPDPEVFLVTAKAMGLSPEECLVIEDATAGIDAANAASFVSVGISYVTEYNKTNVKIDSLKEILTLIDKINS